MTDLDAFLLFGGALLCIVGIGEALRAWAKWKPESSRRIVHMLIGLVVVFGVPMFSSPVPIYLLAVLFVGINMVAITRKWFKGMHAIERKSWGTVTFPLALIVALFLCWTEDGSQLWMLQTAFLVLAISDPLASFVGTRLKNPRPFDINGNMKSVAGSVAFFLSATGIVFAALNLIGTDSLAAGEVFLAAVLVGLIAATVEAVSSHGWDNFWIVLAFLVGLIAVSEYDVGGFAVWLSVVMVFFLVANRLRFLDASGSLVGGLLALVLVLVASEGGYGWILAPLAFFVLASLLSKFGARRKSKTAPLTDKSHKRDAGQVLANGGVGAMVALIYFLLGFGSYWCDFTCEVTRVEHALYWGFVGSFAAAAADTFATEIGTYFRHPTWSVWSLRRVEVGRSGGISIPGLIGAVLGSTAVIWTGWMLQYRPGISGGVPAISEGIVSIQTKWQIAAVLVASGVIASFVDSILGATVQAKYRDSQGRLTERMHENRVALPLVSGYRWMTNDRVNLACTAVGALIPFLYFLLVPGACPWCIG